MSNEWIYTNCHQVPNPPEDTNLKVMYEGIEGGTVRWKKYKLPLRNPKKLGRYVDLSGDAIAHQSNVEAWKIK
jgi:hypothetical protein